MGDEIIWNVKFQGPKKLTAIYPATALFTENNGCSNSNDLHLEKRSNKPSRNGL